jgi:hypothetical protein
MLLAASAHGEPSAAQRHRSLVLDCAVANSLVAAQVAAASPHKGALEKRALAYQRLAREEFGVTDEAIAVGLRALRSKVNTGTTAWSDVVGFAEQCPAVPAA